MKDIVHEIEKKYLKKNIPDLKTGDVVKVHQKIKEGNKERIQIFEGIVIKTHGGKSINATFTVRRVSLGVGIEKIFPLHSPVIIKVEKIKSIKTKKAKLYHLRDIIGKKSKKQKELKDFAMWEEPEAEKEEEKLKEKLEAEAKSKEDAKKKEQEELDKKFAATRGNIPAKEEKKEEGKDEKSEKESGK